MKIRLLSRVQASQKAGVYSRLLWMRLQVAFPQMSAGFTERIVARSGITCKISVISENNLGKFHGENARNRTY